VLHRVDDVMIDVRHARYVAGRIPGARLVELPGRDHLLSVGDTAAILGEVEEFLTGGRHSEPDRVLRTVLFTDICDGTTRAAELGDGRWRDLLAAHDAEVRRQLERFGGDAVKTIGDGFLAVFGGPAQRRRAVRQGDRRRRRRSSASTCARGCTRASASSSATTWAGWPSTSPRA
jgi:class 3 adenylate cyclase